MLCTKHFGCRWIEHDPEEIWQGVELCIQRALQAAQNKAGPIKVKALGITNQRETTLVWDKTTGKPLYNAIVWMDSRTESICKQIVDEHGSKVTIYTFHRCTHSSSVVPSNYAAAWFCHRTTSGLSLAYPSVPTSRHTKSNGCLTMLPRCARLCSQGKHTLVSSSTHKSDCCSVNLALLKHMRVVHRSRILKPLC